MQDLSLHMGTEGIRQLERCRQLLLDRNRGGAILSRGAVIRIALRRLLLALLGDRCDFTAEADPVTLEYLDLLDAEEQSRREDYRPRRKQR